MASAEHRAAAAREDQWAFVKIGEPFPENPVRVKGEMNQYVAVWYKNGNPVFGRAWNNGGVVECSFPNGKKMTRKLGGEIQVLVHQGDFDSNGYWYDWDGTKEFVRCGDTGFIYMKNGAGEVLPGSVNLPPAPPVDFKGVSVPEILIPFRNYKSPMGDAKPEKKEEGLGQMIVELGGMFGQDLWCDVRVGDLWPTHTVAGPLKVGADGTMQEQCAALWWMDKVPVMGRAWKTPDGRIKASFGWHGVEYTNAGSFLLLRHHNSKSHGFEYQWMTCADLKTNKDGWEKVHVSNFAPCINLTKDGREMLGKIDMVKEMASYGEDGKEHVTTGPRLEDFGLLCRRPLGNKTNPMATSTKPHNLSASPSVINHFGIVNSLTQTFNF